MRVVKYQKYPSSWDEVFRRMRCGKWYEMRRGVDWDHTKACAVERAARRYAKKLGRIAQVSWTSELSVRVKFLKQETET